MSRDLRATAILDARDNTANAFTSAARRLAALDGRMKAFNAGQRSLERSQVSVADRRMAALERGRNLLVAGGGMLAAYGVGRGATAAIKRFADVERAMTRVGITGEATDDEIAKGIENMRKLAQDTAMPFDKMREGMEALTSSGKSFQESLAMMPSIARTAQASGASMADTANASVALINHMAIKTEELQKAQDIMAKAGKLGQFEAKDMARYFPSMMPAAASVGFKGIEGLKQLSAIVQTIRSGTGTSEEAAGSAMNIFAKMESEETAKKFTKMGVDLRKEMEAARKKGANLFDTFLDLSNKALKGDMSKLPQLFQDMEVQRGMRPLLKDRQKIGEYLRGLEGSDGTIASDLDRVLKNKQTEVDRLGEAWDRFTTSLGNRLSRWANSNGLTSVLDVTANALDGKAASAGDEGTHDRMRAHRAFAARDRAQRAAQAEVDAEADLRKLHKEIKADPYFGKNIPAGVNLGHDAWRARMARRAAEARAKLDEARARATREVQKAMPETDKDGNIYKVDGGLAVNRLSGAGNPRADFAEWLKQGDKAVPEFKPAVEAAQKAKDDIETVLREIDLATSGQQAGSTFRTGLVSELKQAESESLSIVGRIKAALNFTATPSVKINAGGLNNGVSSAGGEGVP